MSLKEFGLLLSFLAEGIQALKVFITEQQVREAFKGLKDAETDAEKQKVASDIAKLIYRA